MISNLVYYKLLYFKCNSFSIFNPLLKCSESFFLWDILNSLASLFYKNIDYKEITSFHNLHPHQSNSTVSFSRYIKNIYYFKEV